MGLFSRRSKRTDERAVSYQDVWSTGGDVTAISATSIDSALRLAPVYAAVRLIADQGASLPLKAYRQSGAVREPITSTPELLKTPAPGVTPFTWKQQALTSMLLRGNAYGYITAFSGTAAKNLVWLHPDRVQVDESTGIPIYRHNGQMLDVSRVVHIPGLTVAGSCVGVNPITAFRTVIETGLQGQQYTRDWFLNGGPVGAGTHLKNEEMTLTPEQANTAKSRYRASARAGDVLVTGKDWTLSPITVKADDAAFVQTARLTATQIASIYGIPPEMIGGETGTSLTYSTVELNSLNFVTYTLRPWLVRLEEALSAVMPQPQFCRFNVDALLRADTLSRLQAHEIALRTGIETLDEARATEDKLPLTPEQKAELPAANAPAGGMA
jgi:HK97 family phage portal protein